MHSSPDPPTLTLLLNVQLSDHERLKRLLPAVYAQLRATAQAALAMERPDHTLQATALVHEAYLKLAGEREVPWANRAHFFAAAAESMRRILVDHARSAKRVKHGGGRQRLEITGVLDLATADPDEILRFDEIFRRLEVENPDAAAVVRLRFFAGQSIDATAAALDLSPATVDRRWALARAWLYDRLADEGAKPG